MPMLRPLTNLLYRRKDPTRMWRPDATQLVADVRRCTFCDVPVGGNFSQLVPLGPSEDAKQAAKGYPEWPSKGVFCVVEHGRIGDLTIVLRPSKAFRSFPGRFLNGGEPITLTNATRLEELIAQLGEPFGTSNNDWDDAKVLFYEFPAGETQFAFGNDTGALDSIEFWYEPELQQKGACETYGISKVFPEEFKRKLPEGS
jgi:hypothetical protein